MAPNCLGWPDAVTIAPDGTTYMGADDYILRAVDPDGTVRQVAVGNPGGTGLFHRMPTIAFDPLDSSLVVHDVIGWHVVTANGGVLDAPATLVGLTSIALSGTSGEVYSISGGAVVQVGRGM
jgi:hypothetical protein